MAYTLDQKIGQLTLVGFRGSDAETTKAITGLIRRYHLGGVWLTDSKAPADNRISNIRYKFIEYFFRILRMPETDPELSNIA